MSLFVDIRKTLGAFRLDVRFQTDGDILGLLGASGSGKSVTLRCIAGIERPDAGRIVLNGRVLFDAGARVDLPPQARRVGVLFQQYALFPNMTVEENIAAGARRMPRQARQAAVEALLERTQLTPLRRKLPSQLSGGQQQRTALARILISEPEALLLDEPFSALDAHLRDQMEIEVMETLGRFGRDTLIVSHNRDELFRMADRIAVYHDGRIDALDEKHALFASPRTRAAAALTGCKNLSRVENPRREGARTRFFAADWGLELIIPGAGAGTAVGLRRHHLEIAEAPGENVFRLEVASVAEDPFEYVVFLRPPGHPGACLGWTVPRTAPCPRPGQTLLIRLPPEALMPLEG